jgi:hypothetical protein
MVKTQHTFFSASSPYSICLSMTLLSFSSSKWKILPQHPPSGSYSLLCHDFSDLPHSLSSSTPFLGCTVGCLAHSSLLALMTCFLPRCTWSNPTTYQCSAYLLNKAFCDPHLSALEEIFSSFSKSPWHLLCCTIIMCILLGGSRTNLPHLLQCPMHSKNQ